MPPHPTPDTRPRCVVRHGDSFLRYSRGPKQGHFWDVYGEDYLDRELAELAISQAPPPGSGLMGIFPTPSARPDPHGREVLEQAREALNAYSAVRRLDLAACLHSKQACAWCREELYRQHKRLERSMDALFALLGGGR